MQKDDNNSIEAYIKTRNKRSYGDHQPIRERGQVSNGGEIASGDAVYAGAGVSAVETMPMDRVFPLADCESCLDSCHNLDKSKPQIMSIARAGGDAPIVGMLAPLPGQSSMMAAAFGEVESQTSNSYAPSSKPTLQYSATDFRPYR